MNSLKTAAKHKDMPSVLMLLEFEFPQDDRVEKEALTLSGMGYRVAILCPDFSGRPNVETYKDIEIYRFSISKQLFKKLLGLCQIFPFYHNLWQRHVNKLLKTQDFKIIHIHDLPLCKLGVHFKKRNKLLFVADMHENYPAMVSGQEHIKKFPNKVLISIKKWYKLEKRWLSHADHIVCTAPGMIERLKKVVGADKSFALTPNTIHPEAFNASQQRDSEIEKKYDNKFVLLYYGGVSEQRGIQTMIEAVPELVKHVVNLKLVIIGTGNYLKQLKNLAKELKVNEYIDFEGWQPQSKLESYMKNTSIALIPHWKSEHTDNTSPNKLFMFMYFAKPVLVSDCNYMVQVVEYTQSGLIFKSGNPRDFANKLLELYRNSILRQKMGENGRRCIYESYQWDQTVKPLKRIYQLYLEN